MNDNYNKPDIITGTNYTVTVYSPILTPKERERRMEQIKKASVSLVLSKEAKR